MFYLSFNFNFYVSKIVHLCVGGLLRRPGEAAGGGWSAGDWLRPPSIFIAGRPKVALLLWFFGDFRCGALLFVVIHVIYGCRNG